MSLVLTALSYVAPFLAVLVLVITVHEFGHFLAARGFGVAIERFSVGFGRALFSHRDRSGIEWRIGWIPVGGYVMFAGDENAASIPDQDDLDAMRREIVGREGPGAERRYLPFKPVWQRAIVAAAGPAANFLLAIAIFAAIFMTIGEGILKPRVGAVIAGSPAAAAGFQPGDLITQADGKPVSDFLQLHRDVAPHAGVPMTFVVQRGSSVIALRVTPVHDKQTYDAIIGIMPSTSAGDFVHVRDNPITAVAAGARDTWDIVSTTVVYIGRLFRGQESPHQLTSFIGIAQVSHMAVVDGARGEHGLVAQAMGSLVALTGLVAFISVSIGLANLMPIPVLDGGHLLFYAYEAIARRPVSAKVQAFSYRVGLALVIGLMLFATTNDLQRIHLLRFLGGHFS
ncbi:MAG TPA: M50 family metallopeptidase [Caulobacteraceae bacterium]|nr:M50 family metallopeptidase [Caulobacteraceae bacterium]